LFIEELRRIENEILSQGRKTKEIRKSVVGATHYFPGAIVVSQC